MKHLPEAWIWKTFHYCYYLLENDLVCNVYVSFLQPIKTSRYMTCQKNKWYTTVLKSETLNLFQNNSVNSLSLLFLSLQFIFSIHPYESAHDSYIPSLFLLICFKLLITQTFFDFPTRFELSGSTVFYLPNQPIRAPEQIQDRLSYQLVWHFCCWGADVSLTKRPSGEIEAWGNGCIRQLYPLEALTKTFLLTIILST